MDEKIARNKKIVAAALSGMNQAAIGVKYGLHRQRVGQILKTKMTPAQFARYRKSVIKTNAKRLSDSYLKKRVTLK